MSFVKVYIAEFVGDPVRCAKRNIHKRSLDDVKMLKIGWELTPTYMNRLDLSTNLHMVEIEHVEMDEKTFTGDKVEDEETKVGVYCTCLQSPDINLKWLKSTVVSFLNSLSSWGLI